MAARSSAGIGVLDRRRRGGRASRRSASGRGAGRGSGASGPSRRQPIEGLAGLAVVGVALEGQRQPALRPRTGGPAARPAGRARAARRRGSGRDRRSSAGGSAPCRAGPPPDGGGSPRRDRPGRPARPARPGDRAPGCCRARSRRRARARSRSASGSPRRAANQARSDQSSSGVEAIGRDLGQRAPRLVRLAGGERPSQAGAGRMPASAASGWIRSNASSQSRASS